MKFPIIAVGLFMAASAQAAVVSIEIPAYDYNGGPEFNSSGMDDAMMVDANIQLDLDAVKAVAGTGVVYNNIVTGGTIKARYFNWGGDVPIDIAKTFRFYETLPSQLAIAANGNEIFSATAVAEDGELAIWRATLPMWGSNRSSLSLTELFLDPIKNDSMWQSNSGYAGEFFLETSVSFSNAPLKGVGVYWTGDDMVENFNAKIVSETIATPLPGALLLLPSGILGLLTLSRRKIWRGGFSRLL